MKKVNTAENKARFVSAIVTNTFADKPKNKRQLAKQIGIAESTFFEWQKSFAPDVAEAIHRARGRLREMATRALVRVVSRFVRKCTLRGY